VHLVLEPDRLMAPQFGMGLIPFGEDLGRHRRAPAGFALLLSRNIDRPMSRYETTGDSHHHSGKNNAAPDRALTGS
jgi:hypothetical protein